MRRYDENDVEVGVCLFGFSSGKGIAGESLGAAIEFGFRRLPLRRLVCVVRPTNIRSQKAMLRLGFSFTVMTEHLGIVFRF
ncbi:GNAT family N-acetyltransferase [Neorhizobium galegae]|uniref:GNAT family N-acetyltransferase n=1 Tax=Neorhizobium galegae TaxID=399 RepID=UPI00351EE6CC